MSARNALDNQLFALMQKDAGDLSEEDAGVLRKALSAGEGPIAARAASLIQNAALAGFEDDLFRAFERLLQAKPAKDPGCLGKKAIIECLDALDAPAPQILLQGARHVQPEPVWGGVADTAGNLRGMCLTVLAASGHPDVLELAVDLLMDLEPETRKGAAGALAAYGAPEGALLLRLKALAGDAEPAVVGDCLTGIVSLGGEGAEEFVGRFLDASQPALAEEAALALAESRSEEAWRALKGAWEANVEESFRLLLVEPIALLRRDEGFAFLLALIESGSGAMATAAVQALAIHRSDAKRTAEVGAAVDARGEREFARVFNEAFQP